MSHEKQKKSMDLSKSPQLPEEQLEIQQRIVEIQAAALPAIPSLYLAKDMGMLQEKLKGTSDENAKLREKLKAIKKENTSMSEKISALEGQNHHQRDTIRTLEIAQDRLQKDLETVKKAKDKLRIEVEEKISKFSKENEILTEKLDALTREFESVESENKDLKRSLEELTNDNDSLKTTVCSIHKENEKLKQDMTKLRKEHDDIREKLECKETRLALGQVAWMLEAEIWRSVLPGVTMGKSRILFSMERWLKKNATSDQGKAAQKRWDVLKAELNWDDDEHRSALKILKDLRVDDAHPQDVDLEEARKQLTDGDYVGETDKESCEQIIDMITRARAINQ